jgi:hypothetical protein
VVNSRMPIVYSSDGGRKRHDTWSNFQLQALTKSHDSLIQEYKCAEWQSQDPDAVGRAPAAPAAEQVPQVTTLLLIPPLNQLDQLSAVGAHGEIAENAQEDMALGCQTKD